MTAADTSEYEKTAGRIQALVEQAAEKAPDIVVLPECAYPAYMLEYDREETARAMSMLEKLKAALADQARRHGFYLVAGLPHREGETLYNAALVYSPQGELTAWAGKQNLWHFDHKSFTVGTAPQVFDTPFGRVGLMICADGRIPEVARSLRLQGAGLILDLVNLVAGGSRPEELQNQQRQFMLSCRAAENGAAIAVCNKCGVERGMITYLGRSCVYGRDGGVLAQCGPAEEEILVCDLEEISPGLGEQRNLLTRRSESYQPLADPGGCKPVLERGEPVYTILARFKARDEAEYRRLTELYLRGAQVMDARLILLPEWTGELAQLQLARLAENLPVGVCLLVAGEGPSGQEAELWARKGRVGAVKSAHCAGEGRISVLQGGNLRLGVCFGAEPWTPELVRVQMLLGADISVWYTKTPWPEELQRTRAAENRIFVAQMALQGTCSLTTPDGAVCASTYGDGAHAATAYINTALSRWKDVVPGTNIVTDRHPELMKGLT